MMAIVHEDLALLENGEVWILGCVCTTPRRKKEKITPMPELVERIKKLGKRKEIR